MLDRNTPNVTLGANTIVVSRDSLMQDAMAQFAVMDNPKKVLQVTFHNEMSQDMGGVSREFFTTIMKEMLSDAFGLFSVASTE